MSRQQSATTTRFGMWRHLTPWRGKLLVPFVSIYLWTNKKSKHVHAQRIARGQTPTHSHPVLQTIKQCDCTSPHNAAPHVIRLLSNFCPNRCLANNLSLYSIGTAVRIGHASGQDMFSSDKWSVFPCLGQTRVKSIPGERCLDCTVMSDYLDQASRVKTLLLCLE